MEKFLFCHVKFCGHVKDSSGISLDAERITTIHRLKRHRNDSDLCRFLGMAKQASKFVPNLAEMKNTFAQSPQQANLVGMKWCPKEHAYNKLKATLSSSPVLAPRRETATPADVSIQLQCVSEKGLRLVANISRAMPPTEIRYAQIDKETTALIWTCKGFSDYLL